MATTTSLGRSRIAPIGHLTLFLLERHAREYSILVQLGGAVPGVRPSKVPSSRIGVQVIWVVTQHEAHRVYYAVAVWGTRVQAEVLLPLVHAVQVQIRRAIVVMGPCRGIGLVANLRISRWSYRMPEEVSQRADRERVPFAIRQ
jgi:hypothetical protein